jgi:hypothetical protein
MDHQISRKGDSSMRDASPLPIPVFSTRAATSSVFVIGFAATVRLSFSLWAFSHPHRPICRAPAMQVGSALAVRFANTSLR